MRKVLFVGAGNMGRAILSRALSEHLLETNQVVIKEHVPSTCEELTRSLGVEASTSYPDLSTIDTVVLAVKPYILPEVLAELRALGTLSPSAVLISVAAGVNFSMLRDWYESDQWIRVMPNTPVMIGEGMIAVSTFVESDEVPEVVTSIFGKSGKLVAVSEANLERLGAYSGTGPGYFYTLLDAMADAGVAIGLTRPLAIEAAAQTMLGASKMLLETGLHPSVLRDQVTSPGGTTVAGILALEKAGGRAALQAAVHASYEKALATQKK